MDVGYRYTYYIAADIRHHRSVNTEPLIRFWQDSFKVQVQARTNNIEVHIDGGLPLWFLCNFVLRFGRTS